MLEPKDYYDPSDGSITHVRCYKELKFFGRTLSIFRSVNLDFAAQVWTILRENDIDLIQISHPSGAAIVKLVTILTRRRIPLAYSPHDIAPLFVKETFVSNPKYSGIEKLLVLRYLTWSDQIVCKHIADHVVAVSDKDRAFLIDRYGLNPTKVSVIPSGCNLVSVADEAEKLQIRKELGIASSAIVAVFHGMCSHFPNRKAVESIENYIAPRFAKIDHRVLFLIGGYDCPTYEKANVKSVGLVESLHAFLSAADIAVVPLTFGAGTKLKMFDYMSVGLPIVTTAKGMEGITVEDGKNALVVADVDADFTERLKYLTDNEEARKRIGANARKLLEEKYTWDDIGADLIQVYNGILKAN